MSGFLAAVILAACTGPEPEPTGSVTPTPTTTSSTATPTPTTDPEIVAAEEAILEAYRGYWAAKVASYADPTRPQDPNLEVYADDTALTDAQTTIFTLRENGIAIPGEPVLAPVVSDIVLSPEASATIRDCVDAANWQPIYVATGEKPSSRRPRRRHINGSVTARPAAGCTSRGARPARSGRVTPRARSSTQSRRSRSPGH